MATLAKPLIGMFNGLRRVAIRGSRCIPPLASLHLSDHDLADLNLPFELRARLETERVRERGDRFNMYR